MALYDIGGTTTGSATVGSSVALNHEITDPLSGSSNVTANAFGLFNVSGLVVGSGDLVDARLADLAGVADGNSVVLGDLLRQIGVRGFVRGNGLVALSMPEPIYGIGKVVAYMDIVHVPPPICEVPTVSAVFRWGHIFTKGDLEFSILGGGIPVSISYTVFQIQQGCTWRQIGPSGRVPVSSGAGCYYITGTAGECGQPGLWVVRWCYQRTYNDPVMEEDCYFQVTDAVTCPVSGDDLERHCKYGWN